MKICPLIAFSSIALFPVFLGFGLFAQSLESFSKKTSIEISLVRDNFATFLNKQHSGNRIGYRFFEHSPSTYGEVPLSNKDVNLDTTEISSLKSIFQKQKNVFVYKHKIEKDENWSRMDWTYYMVPVTDGIEVLLVVETYNEGLPEYYGIQQCFRMSGETNKAWRKNIARTPAFSEYDLWAKEDTVTSLSYVYRNDKWYSMPATSTPVGARTPLGIAVDHLRTQGNMTSKVGPYEAKILKPIDHGIITRTNKDGNWICGIYWENTSHVTNHHPADCLHPIVNIGNIPPRSKRALRGKIYWFKGNKNDLYEHFQADFGEIKKKGKLRIASSQFPITGNINENARWIKKQIREAKVSGADIVHFPECALSGYGGGDVKDFNKYDWKELKSETESIIVLAKELNIWVLLGSSHKLSDDNKPHNSSYVISSNGQVIDRYDKRFCTTGDLKYYTPGDHFSVFEINGIKCGLLICYDLRFPEIFREYKKLDVNVIFHSFYNARHKENCIHPKIMPVTAQARAATNYFFMSLTNSSAPYSWPCHFITPDGLIENKLPANKPGVLMSEVDISKEYYDASKPFRMDAIKGKLNSGDIIKDSRSRNRKIY
ncbi:MAG: carbon-nitrogen hydrolase family protein [Fidelibacterota bacterium]|nr:MAG: carbon-nitrogen hydrolase family protein [Candidatus Neomarinimicrobiota bacterium]